MAVGDIDGDGDLDLFVGGQFRTGRYPQLVRSTLWLNDAGTLRLSEAASQPLASAGVVNGATLVDLDGDRDLDLALAVEWGPVRVFRNQTGKFEDAVSDVDGDGIEDLFLSQNRSDLLPELSRDDAGRGLWLRGKGDGDFEALDASITGIAIPGEQRGAALADFNHDGRVDVVVTQNDGPTHLFVNRGARPGLRVVLDGGAANPDGIGAQIRLRFHDGNPGPLRAVQAGSG